MVQEFQIGGTSLPAEPVSRPRREYLVEEFQHHLVELLRLLQRRKVTDIGNQNEASSGDCAGDVFGMLPLDELVVFAEHAPDRNTDAGEIARRVFRLTPLHEAD